MNAAERVVFACRHAAPPPPPPCLYTDQRRTPDARHTLLAQQQPRTTRSRGQSREPRLQTGQARLVQQAGNEEVVLKKRKIVTNRRYLYKVAGRTQRRLSRFWGWTCVKGPLSSDVKRRVFPLRDGLRSPCDSPTPIHHGRSRSSRVSDTEVGGSSGDVMSVDGGW